MRDILLLGEPMPPALLEAIQLDRNPACVYLASLAAGSRSTMRRALQNIAEDITGGHATLESLPWHGLRYQHTQAVRAKLLGRFRPSNVNKHLAALRGVLKQCWKLGLMSADDYHAAADLKVVRGSALPPGRALSSGELRSIFAGCDAVGGARDAALLALLYGAGLRRSELAALDLAGYDAAAGCVRVRGKGAKERLVPLSVSVRSAVDAWLQRRGYDAGPLFCRVNKSGRIAARGLSHEGIARVCHRCARRVGVAKFSPHDLRRTYISDLLDAGADIVTVKRLAGHEDVATTAAYDRRGEREKAKAAELIHIPILRR